MNNNKIYLNDCKTLIEENINSEDTLVAQQKN